MNKKRVIKLNENQLKKIVTESVKRVLKESQQTDLDVAVEKMINALDETSQKLILHFLKRYHYELMETMLDILQKKGIEDYEDIDPDDLITTWGDHNYDI